MSIGLCIKLTCPISILVVVSDTHIAQRIKLALVGDIIHPDTVWASVRFLWT